jgi:hypothetical protein
MFIFILQVVYYLDLLESYALTQMQQAKDQLQNAIRFQQAGVLPCSSPFAAVQFQLIVVVVNQNYQIDQDN